MYASGEFIRGELQNASTPFRCCCATAVPIEPGDAMFTQNKIRAARTGQARYSRFRKRLLKARTTRSESDSTRFIAQHVKTSTSRSAAAAAGGHRQGQQEPGM